MQYLGYVLGAVLMALLLVVGGAIAFVLGWFFWMMGAILFEILAWTLGG